MYTRGNKSVYFFKSRISLWIENINIEIKKLYSYFMGLVISEEKKTHINTCILL